MKVYDAAAIRNIAVVGHGGCGKTSLVSALLFDTGAQTRLGRVDDGSAPTDFDENEVERKISLQTALAFGEWKKVKLNLLDTERVQGYFSELARESGFLDAVFNSLWTQAAMPAVTIPTGRGLRGLPGEVRRRPVIVELSAACGEREEPAEYERESSR